MKTPGAVASKAHLRDSIKRLQGIRKRCGKEDEEKEMESTGDPFRDKTSQFIRDISAVKEMILERNEGVKKAGQDRDAIEQSHDINKLLRQLDHELLQIKGMVDQSDRALAKANRKKKAPQKISLLEQQLRGRQASYENCSEVLSGVKTMNDQRFGGGATTKKGKGAAASPQMTIGKKMLMRQQLLDITKSRAEDASSGQTPGGGAHVNLDEAPETAEQMKVLRSQDAKIQQGLDRLSKGVSRLHELAIQIGSEIDVQNKMLDETEDKVDAETKKLKQVNKRLKGLLKKSKPMNTFINIGCFLLLLGLVGYFLYEFNVV